MNRTLIGLLITMIVLGALAVSLVGQDKPAPAEGWRIDGFATPDQLQADRERGMLDPQVDMPSPIDEIEISRSEGDVRLVKIGDGPKPDWALTAPQSAPAVRFRVDNMVKLFKDETVSIHSTRITPEDRPLFDLEDGRFIRVKMKADGALWQGLDLLIGKVDTSKEESLGPVPTKDTWIQVAGQPDVAYRIGGKDLRAPFESPLKDLRDRRFFSLKPEELETLKITPPGGQVISLKGTRKETPAPTKGVQPKVEMDWAFATDMGFGLDPAAAKAVTRAFANTRAKDFYEAKDVPAKALENPWRFEATATEDRTFAMLVGSGDAEEIWVQMDQANESATVDQHTAKGLRQSAADLRDRTMVHGSFDDVAQMTLHSVDEGPITVKRDGKDWSFAGGPVKGPVDPGYHLKGAMESRAKRYPRPDELETAGSATREPEMVVEIVTSAGATRIGFGPKMTDKPYNSTSWAQITEPDGTSRLVLVQDATTRRFRKSTQDLRWKRLFAFDKANANRIEIQAPDAQTPGVILTRGEDGKMVLGDAPEGKTVKSGDLVGITATLASLAAKDFHPRMKAKALGLVAGKAWSIRVTLKDTTTRTLLLTPKGEDGATPRAISDGGPLEGTIVSLNPFQADKLRKSLDDLVK